MKKSKNFGAIVAVMVMIFSYASASFGEEIAVIDVAQQTTEVVTAPKTTVKNDSPKQEKEVTATPDVAVEKKPVQQETEVVIIPDTVVEKELPQPETEVAAEPDPIPEIVEENEEEIFPAMVKVTFVTPTSNHIEEVESGMPVDEPPVQPTLEGHIFLHWFNQESDEVHNFADPISTDTTLVACFEKLPEPPAQADTLEADATEKTSEETSEKTNEDTEIPEVDIELVFEGEAISLGDCVTFVAKVEGAIAFQWQYSQDNGITWFNIDGETEQEMKVVVSRENAVNIWRVAVSY